MCLKGSSKYLGIDNTSAFLSTTSFYDNADEIGLFDGLLFDSFLAKNGLSNEKCFSFAQTTYDGYV